MQQICERRLPRVSRCMSTVNDCPKEQRANFSHLENAYRRFHRVICTQESFDGLRDLWDCLDRQRRKKCDKDTDELLGASESFPETTLSEEGTTLFTDLVKHEQPSQGHYDNTTPVPSNVQRVSNGFKRAATVIRHTRYFHEWFDLWGCHFMRH
ncbi:hypothetical protein MTO96_025424 [Rhipicephalus appendiculatus]